MVTLVQRLSTDAFRRGGGAAKLDLAPYRGFLEGLQKGEGAVIELEPGEQQRVVKRRLSLAGRERNLGVKWLTAAPNHLRFQLTERKERSAPRAAAAARGGGAQRGRRAPGSAAASRRRQS